MVIRAVGISTSGIDSFYFVEFAGSKRFGARNALIEGDTKVAAAWGG